MESLPAVFATEAYLASVLAQLVVIILVGRAMNRLFVALGQPGAVGEIVGGLMLGPSLLGALAPGVHADLFAPGTARTLFVIGQIGLVLLMFEIGADFAFDRLTEPRLRRAVLLVAFASVSVPFAAGLAVGLLTHASHAPGIDRTAYVLFLGVALAITAVPILGRILRGFDLHRTPIGVVAISAAALNDIAGWLLLAAIAAAVMATLDGGFLPTRLAALGALALAVRFLLLPLARLLVARAGLAAGPGPIPPSLMALVIAIAFGLALVTEAIGIFAIFGGFAAGYAFHRERHFVAAWKGEVGRFLLVFFLPVFFTLTGLRTDILGLTPADLPTLALVLGAAILAKILPTVLAARLGGFTAAEGWVLGSLMNTRALMELIVLNIARDLGVLPPGMFTMLVLMALVTTMMTGPLLRHFLPRAGYPLPARGSGDS